jgi:hypothetical protein
VFFNEFDPYTFASQSLHNPAQVIQVTDEPIHAMDENRIAASHKTHQQIELRPFRIFT